MPVTLLLCEGVSDSPDVRVLNKLLRTFCRIVPIGSKHAMDTQILLRREVSPRAIVMGLKDADFDRVWNAPADRPELWTKRLLGARIERIGWSWARKEIEI